MAINSKVDTPMPKSGRARRYRALVGGAMLILAISACAGPGVQSAAERSSFAVTDTATASTEPTAPVEITETPTAAAATSQPVADPVPVASDSQPVAPPATSTEPTRESVEPPAPAQDPEPTPQPAEPEEVAEPSGYGCDAALAYLRANAEPSFQLVCPGNAFGGQGVTCYHHAPECPGIAVIIIHTPCETAYKNEAANSWTVKNKTGAVHDPFGARC